MAGKIKHKLEANGVIEEKIIQSITDKYTKHLKGEEYSSKQQMLINSHQAKHEYPPIIIANNIELKIYL